MKQLSFAIMCEDSTLAEWQAACVKSLLANPSINLKLLIKNAHQPRSFWSRLANLKFDRLFFLIFSKTLFKPPCNRPVDMREYYRDVSLIECTVKTKGQFSQYFSNEDVTLIKSYSLDFILRFGFNIIRGEILTAANYGVWSFHHGDPKKYRGGPPCFWEIYNRDFVTGAMLQQLTNALDKGVVLKQGFFKTCLHSFQKSTNDIYQQTAQWPLQVCEQLLLGSDIVKGGAIQTEAPMYYPPGNFTFIYFLFKLLRNKIATFGKHFLFREVWNVGVIAAPIQAFLQSNFSPAVNFLPVTKATEFRADPFGFIFENSKFILLEHYDFNKSVGKIECWEHRSSGSFEKQEQWIDTAVHRSYPFIFEDEGDLYCTPESSKMEKVSRFKFYKGKWKDEGVIMEGKPFVDPTLLKYNGKYWIFYTLANQNSDVNLFISYSNSMDGPWTDHPRNPVKSDITSSRPAGSFFWNNHTLYRPAQNCSRTYGGSITINEVILLSESDYKEQAVQEILPWHKEFNTGIHTLAVLGDQVLIDAKRNIFWPVK